MDPRLSPSRMDVRHGTCSEPLGVIRLLDQTESVRARPRWPSLRRSGMSSPSEARSDRQGGAAAAKGFATCARPRNRSSPSRDRIASITMRAARASGRARPPGTARVRGRTRHAAPGRYVRRLGRASSPQKPGSRSSRRRPRRPRSRACHELAPPTVMTSRVELSGSGAGHLPATVERRNPGRSSRHGEDGSSSDD